MYRKTSHGTSGNVVTARSEWSLGLTSSHAAVTIGFESSSSVDSRHTLKAVSSISRYVV